ncbi:MAG: NAD(P)H-hydrate epimerase [Planctomycetota bacterium]|nr:MAG: NAD(P)H-hydrate epimerase [Planctomycetota bacterium]
MIPLRKEKIRLLDGIAINDYKIPAIVLMENAGTKASEIIFDDLENPTVDKVIILCGKGNNGGDGMVIARHLSNRGVSVKIILFADRKLISGDAKCNLVILDKMKVPIDEMLSLSKLFEDLKNGTLIIDALLGTGVDGIIKDSMIKTAEFLNASDLKVIAIDTPTGLNCDNGEILGECIKANKTITFVAKKLGFILKNGPEYCGEIIVVDISIPVDVLVSVQQKELEYLEKMGINPFENP